MITSVACSVLLVKASKAKEPEAVPSLISFRPKFVKVPMMFGPNITGQFTITNGAESCSGAKDASNAFSLMPLGTGITFYGSDNRYEQHAISFSAERGSSLYGASFEVQPLSSRLLPCIKI